MRGKGGCLTDATRFTAVVYLSTFHVYKRVNCLCFAIPHLKSHTRTDRFFDLFARLWRIALALATESTDATTGEGHTAVCPIRLRPCAEGAQFFSRKSSFTLGDFSTSETFSVGDSTKATTDPFTTSLCRGFTTTKNANILLNDRFSAG